MQRFDHLSLEEKLKKVDYVVEATSGERYLLWDKYHKDYLWEDCSGGHSVELGKIKKRPVWMTFRFATIDKKIVLFYCSESQLTDWVMVDEFLAKHCTPMDGTRKAKCDASSFGSFLHYTKR